MSEIEETAKAVGEVAKCGTKLIDSGDKLGGFLSDILGDIFVDSVGIIGDKIKYWRTVRINRMIDKYNEYSEERGSESRKIPLKFAFSMIENASLEEDNNLQDMWCKLIANSSNPNFNSEIRYAFIDILKNLTFLDSQILEVTYNNAVKYSSSYALSSYFSETDSTEPEIVTDEKMIRRIGISKELLISNIKCEKKQLDISVDNLLRVQCLKDSSFEASAFGAEGVQDLICSDDRYTLTSLGIALIEACIK